MTSDFQFGLGLRLRLDNLESIMSSLRMDLENEWISIRMDCNLKILNFEISKILLEKKYFNF